MEQYKVAELWWGLDSMNYGFLYCSFSGLSFEIFVFLQLSFFHSTHCPGGLGSSLLFFSASSKENSLWEILPGAARCGRSPLEGGVTWPSAHKRQFGVKLG